MQKIIICLLTVILLSACSAAPTQPALSQNQMMETALSQAMGSLTAAAPISTQTLAATETPLPAPTEAASAEIYAWNYLGTQDSGGVVMTIGRVLLTKRDAVPEIKADLEKSPILANKPVVLEIIFIIENKTDKIVSVYTNQGKVLAGSEQVNMLDFAMGGGNLKGNYSGDILPGAKLVGGLWVGFERVSLEEINSVTIFVNGPSDPQSFSSLGPDYNFVLDLSQRKYEEMPAELK